MRKLSVFYLDKVRAAIRQSGAVRGALHLLLLSMSASLTKQLGMAPGGEFRAAVQAAQQIPGCFILLGDRAFDVSSVVILCSRKLLMCSYTSS
jgi:pheromone shutdown protein TraB